MPIFSAIGAAVAGALFTSAAAISLATSVIAGALAFGASLAYSYLNRPKKRKYTAVQAETKYGGDVSVETLFGVGKTKGQRAFYAKWGAGNKFNAEVFLLANGWCDGLENYIYFFGKIHGLFARAIIGNEVAHFGVNGFGERISIRFYDGRPGQQVDQRLVNMTAVLGNTWKSTSRLSNLCYVVVEREYDADLFTEGKPDFEFVLRGLREYDPRKDSTVVGGSGPQRLPDSATWVFTENPAVHRFNYQIGLRAAVSGRTLIGEGKTIGQLDLGTYFVAMNVCDTNRLGKPTYRCSLWVNGDDDHTEILKEFDDAMAGYGLNRRGLGGVIAGAPQIPVATITPDDTDIGRAAEFQFKKSAFERYNHLSGQFTSIQDMWNPQSLIPIYVNADIAADGRSRQTSNDFLQVTDADTAQYLLTIRYRQQRLGGTATIPVSRRFGLQVQEGEWVTWNSRTWMIEEWNMDEQFNITLKLSETSASIYDNGGIQPGPVIIPPSPPVNPSILTTVQDFRVETGMIEGAQGFQTPCLLFGWTPPNDPTITEVIFQYRIDGETEVFTDSCKEPEAGIYKTSKDVISGVIYNARATIRTVPDRFKTFTPWINSPAATGNQTVYTDIDLGPIQQTLGWLRNIARTTQDAIDGLISAQMEMSTVAFKDTRELARELSVDLGAARADYTEKILLAVNETNAVASKVENLTAALGGNTAEINVAWAAVATEVGFGASYQLTAAVNDGEYRSAAMGLNVPVDPDGPTQIVMEADQFVFSNGGGFRQYPFIYQGGALTLNVANIGTVNSGVINSLNGKMTINLNNGTIVIRS